jgi:hypothetical protein
MVPRHVIWLATAAIVGLAANGSAISADAPSEGRIPMDFNRDIRPILSDRCYACHGPDTQQVKASLQLDRARGLFEELPSGAIAVVPGKLDESRLWEVVSAPSDDPEHMPPVRSGKSLSEAEIERIRSWIEQGAPWQGHWAYLTPRISPAPAIEQMDRARNTIDSFVLRRLEDEGLTTADPASPHAVIRRLSLDLTGLPPDPEEVLAFASDTRPTALARLVDRLLASPRHGERLASIWLDAARYADTNGYHIDNHRDIWLYRNWVIDAFNRDMPFDRFTIEQFAGDLLPEPTQEQRIATGFHRNVMVNFEGGADPEEYLTKYVGDRVVTTATVFLGTTLACAECHDHKYDPFTQNDFYKLYAFFNTIQEQGLDGNKESPAPRLKVPSPEQSARLAQLDLELARLEKLRGGPMPRVDAQQTAWERSVADRAGNPLLGWRVLEADRATAQGGATLSKQPDGSILVSGANPDHDSYEILLRTTATGIRAIRLEALADERLPHRSAARSDNGNFVLTEFRAEAMPANKPASWRDVDLTNAKADHAQTEGGDFSAHRAIDGDPKTGWAVTGYQRREDRRAVFETGSPLGFEGGTVLRIRMRFDSEFAKHTIGRFRLAVTVADHATTEADPPKEVLDAIALDASARDAGALTRIREYFRTTYSPEHASLVAMIAKARKARAAFDKTIPVTMVMQEMPEPKRKTFVLMRGDFRRKGPEVAAGTPASLPPLPEGPVNRLSLARWLVDPANPLTARVTVNRIWQQFFGAGLVRTTNDFGLQGEWPSHPELLDHLACLFRDEGWGVKAIERRIVSSATYLQDSKVLSSLLERDPENRLLARGPRFRLDAESIRDQSLFVAGLLDGRMGGPSVYPYQPGGLWEEVAFGGDFSSQKYEQSHGADLYRRAMYVYWKRSVPYPSMTAFDAPNRELCAVSRPRTNTPLQALVLMNDPAYIEAARKLAERILLEPGLEDSSRIAAAFLKVTSRPPTSREAALLSDKLQAFREAYRTNPDAAARLLSVGESPRDQALPPAEHAAWSALANLLLNLDEVITRN